VSRVGPDGFARLRVAGPTRRRQLSNVAFLSACTTSTALVILPLTLIVWQLVARGLPALRLSFFFNLPKPVGEPGGGMANAIVGTLILLGIGVLFAVPVGVATGVYLAEYGRDRFASVVRYTADIMSGVPSIIVGVATYGLIVVPMGRFSAIAGGVALGLLMLPLIVRTTEEVVRMVPGSYREAALALGAPHWSVILQVVLPAALPGIMTATMLSVARAAGETAPLLFTALGNRFGTIALDRPIAALPLLIYDYARAPYSDWNRQAWTGALVLLMLVTVVSALVRITTRRTPRP
jgi:phosphate transport system permease protein